MLYSYLFILVQILLESFPVSSSGHIALLDFFFTHIYPNDISYVTVHASSLTYHVWVSLLHIPTIVIIILFFSCQWISFFRNIVNEWIAVGKLLLLIILADSVTTLFFIVFKLIPCITIPLSVGFLITASLLCSLYWCARSIVQQLTWYDAVLFGIVQGIALLPGISRFASVFVIARWRGFSGYHAFAIAWMIELPLLIASAIVFVGYAWMQKISLMALITYNILFLLFVTSIVSFLCFCCVAWLMYHNHGWWFAWYMLIPLSIALGYSL